MARPRLSKALSYCRTEIRGMSPYLSDALSIIGGYTKRTKAEVIHDAFLIYVQHLLDQGVILEGTARRVTNEEFLALPQHKPARRVNGHGAA